MISGIQRLLFVLSLLLLALTICNFSTYNMILADNNKKLSIQCADSVPCLDGICIGNPCSPAKNQYASDASYNTKQSINIDGSSNSFEQIRSSTDSMDKHQDTNNDNMCIKSPVSTVINTSEKKDLKDVKNVLDNNLNTKWSLKDGRSYIQMDLGGIKSICSIDIHWYKAEKGTYHFVISTSMDGITFTTILRGTSDRTGIGSENYPIIKDLQGRYIRLDASRDSDVSGVSEIGIYTKNIKNVNASGAQPPQYLVSSNNSSSSISKLDNRIAPSQYVDLISPLIETNHLPMIIDKNVEDTSTASAIQIGLAGNDINKSGVLKFSIIELPVHGILRQGSIANSVIYTPINGFSGTDTFTYNAIDDHGKENLKGRVNILIGNSYPL